MKRLHPEGIPWPVSIVYEEMEILGRQSPFVVEGTRFIGVLCCLVLKKTMAYAHSKIPLYPTLLLFFRVADSLIRTSRDTDSIQIAFLFVE